jgi:hypothetical protein
MELPIWNSRAPALQEADSSSSPPQHRTLKQLTLENCDDIFCLLESFSVLVCKQHCTGVINLDKHLREQHATPAKLRKEIVERFKHVSRTDSHRIELPEQPAWPIEELGSPLDGFKCTTCSFITLHIDSMRKHWKNSHETSWAGDKSALYGSVKVQTFFSSGGLQKYFIVDLGVGENGENFNPNQVVQQQLNNYQKVRQQLEEEMQVIEEAAKTKKTGWFKRTGWLTFFEGRNLAHLGHQARLPDRNEVKRQAAAELTERLIEKCVKGLATLPRETRRWLRSAKQAQADQRPLARLQNPESQATYAGYIVRFVCFYPRALSQGSKIYAQFEPYKTSFKSQSAASERAIPA